MAEENSNNENKGQRRSSGANRGASRGSYGKGARSGGNAGRKGGFKGGSPRGGKRSDGSSDEKRSGFKPRGDFKGKGGYGKRYGKPKQDRFRGERQGDSEQKGRNGGARQGGYSNRKEGFEGGNDFKKRTGGFRKTGEGAAREDRRSNDRRQNGRAGEKGFSGNKRFGDNKRSGARSGEKRFNRERRDDAKLVQNDAQAIEETSAESMKERAWTPAKERTVKSKKQYDQERVGKLVEAQETIYRGELDPRKKDEDADAKSGKKGPVTLKADEDIDLERYARSDESSDFRDLFERCEASPARLGALYVTRKVRKRGAYAQELIETAIDNSRMSAADRSFATLLILGVVSTWGTLDDVINRALQSPRDITPDVRDAMRISTYEIIMLGKAPHAALDQGVELVRAVAPSASRLGNAVLHRVLAMKDDFPFGDPRTDIEALARKFAFPTWMARKLVEDLGAQPASALMTASNDPAPLFIAVNSIKATDDEVINVFEECGAKLVPASSDGVAPAGCYAVSNPRVLADGRISLLFSQGKILVSDASAQVVAASLFEDGDPGDVLEIGAGRGTKTILIQSNANRLLGKQVNLTSMDSHAFKADLLEQRAAEYGVEIDRIIAGNAMRLEASVDDALYDTVFIDAPCSGLGTLRRHQEIRWRMTPESIDEMVKTQLGMLKSAASHVKPGGSIIYATCTVTYDENFGMVKTFLESEEGKDFALAPISGKACFSSMLTPNSPDAHFAAKFVRKE